MRRISRALPLSAAVFCAGCSLLPAPKSEQKAPAPVPSPKITQFYATLPKMQPGDKELLCYGVENAIEVYLEPPRQQLTASLSRCVEVVPSKNTVYRLTAESADGQKVTQDVTVTVGAARAKIVEVRVNNLNAKRGETVSLCWSVSSAQSVTIDPIGFKAGSGAYACTTHQPKETTTYVVTAHGADGDQDSEKVTVKVH